MHIICVDNRQNAGEYFRQTVSNFSEIDSIHLLADGESTLKWIESHPVDLAFLEMELPDMHGLVLAAQLQSIDANIRVVFLTEQPQYALEAFGVGAIGYVLKPYGRPEMRRELDKAIRIQPIRQKQIVIQTIPDFSITVDGIPVRTKHRKALELLALLVDRRGTAVTSGEAIACLWPDKIVSESLFRVTWKRLTDTLEHAGIGWVLVSKGKQKYILTDGIDCDLYRILDGDRSAANCYAGEYLREYEWAETRNAQLSQMLDIY